MNVLSLFDGMSCGQIALKRQGINVDKYFASEIKPHAINLTKLHFPDTIHLGDVRNVKSEDLPKIDLLIGGSPCQDFSAANKERKGLSGLKSVLFYEYLRLLKECNPKYFLLENVEMGDRNVQILSDLLGCYPVNINSELVSGQFRNRYYWTNINGFSEDLFGQKYSHIPQPKNKNIRLSDILENGYTDKIKARCLNTKSGCSEKNWESFWNRYTTTGMVTAIFQDPSMDYKKGIRHFTQTELERLQTVDVGYTKSLSRSQAWNLLGDGWTIDVICHILSYLK